MTKTTERTPAPTITPRAPIRARLQRFAKSQAQVSVVPPIVQATLDSSGAPLDTATRAAMESRFGHNFANVRVHTDARASESARAVNALAYTVGRDIVFEAGQYGPRSSEGQKLLAHELTHVAQQARASSEPHSLEMGRPKSEEEREAETNAGTVSHGQDALSVSIRAPEVRLQRQGMGEKHKWEDELAVKSPQRHPPAPHAWQGLEIYDVVEPELEGLSKFAPTKGHMVHDDFRIVPQLVSADDQRVAFYIAYNTVTQRNEFAIGPEKLDYFLAHTTYFKGAARIFYPGVPGSKPAANEIETARMIYYASQGEATKALGAWASSWSEAAKDPVWVVGATVATLAPFVPAKPTVPRAAASEVVSEGVVPQVVPKAAVPEGVPEAASPKATPPVSAPKPAPKGAIPETAGPKVGAKGTGAAGEEAGVVKAAKAKADEMAAKAGAPASSAERTAQKPLELNGVEMQQRVEGAFKQNSSILKELADAQGKSAAEIPQAVDKVLKDFTKKTGIKVEKVPEGEVVKARGPDNNASLRSRPGYLQIEAQIFDNPESLLKEVTHELAFYYSESLTQVCYLKGFPFATAVDQGLTANNFLELMIKNGSNLPADLLVLLQVTF